MASLELFPRRARSVLAAGVLLATLPGAAWCATPPANCPHQRQLSAGDYWMQHDLGETQGVHDQSGDRIGYLGRDSAVCFRVPLADINAPLAKLTGAKRAAAELLHSIYARRDAWDQPEVVDLRRKFTAIVGQEFASFEQLQRWWIENNDYLAWSDARAQLVLDEKAKQSRAAIAPLKPVQQITAQKYWMLEAMGWLRDVREDGSTLQATAWDGERDTKVSIAKRDTEDRAARQAGYLQAARTIVEDRFTLPELGADSERKLVERLQHITNERLSDRGSWIAWWKANRTRLVLSADGAHLVPKS